MQGQVEPDYFIFNITVGKSCERKVDVLDLSPPGKEQRGLHRFLRHR